MPGVTEQQLHKHSGLRTRQIILADRSITSEYYLTGDPQLVAVGTRLEQTSEWKSGAHEPGAEAVRSVSLQLDCDGTVATRVVKVKLFGEDQFGKSNSEVLSLTTTADGDVYIHSVNVYSKLTGAELQTNTGTVAGDAIAIGHLHNGFTHHYALPVKLRSSADIIGGLAWEAGVEVDVDLGSHVTFNAHANSVTLAAAVSPDGGHDRMFILCVRTNDR